MRNPMRDIDRYRTYSRSKPEAPVEAPKKKATKKKVAKKKVSKKKAG